jgi:hypothetical protein
MRDDLGCINMLPNASVTPTVNEAVEVSLINLSRDEQSMSVLHTYADAIAAIAVSAALSENRTCDVPSLPPPAELAEDPAALLLLHDDDEPHVAQDTMHVFLGDSTATGGADTRDRELSTDERECYLSAELERLLDTFDESGVDGHATMLSSVQIEHNDLNTLVNESTEQNNTSIHECVLQQNVNAEMSITSENEQENDDYVEMSIEATTSSQQQTTAIMNVESGGASDNNPMPPVDISISLDDSAEIEEEPSATGDGDAPPASGSLIASEHDLSEMWNWRLTDAERQLGKVRVHVR